MTFKTRRIILKTLFWASKFCTRISIKLVRLTGKSKHNIHPKHLINEPEHIWYINYIKQNDYVLDLGCGNGSHTFTVAERCKHVIGVEINTKELYYARSKMKVRKLTNVEFYFSSIYDFLKIQPNESFDVVLLLDVLEHLLNRDTVLQDINRILKPNGRLLISIPNAETTWKRRLRSVGLPYYSDDDHKIEYTEKTIKEELTRNGFVIVEPFHTIVYDSPIRGFIDLFGGISLSIYRRLQRWNRTRVVKHPKETIGWRIIAKKD